MDDDIATIEADLLTAWATLLRRGGKDVEAAAKEARAAELLGDVA